jgi:hypothetical protein
MHGLMPAVAARFHWHWQRLMVCNARLVHKHKETVLNKVTPSWAKHKIAGLIHALLAAAWPGEGPVPNARDTSDASASSPWQALASAELLRLSCKLTPWCGARRESPAVHGRPDGAQQAAQRGSRVDQLHRRHRRQRLLGLRTTACQHACAIQIAAPFLFKQHYLENTEI